MRRTHMSVLGACIALFAIAAPAAAEGGWDSYISARPGYGSRTWVDKNVDNASGYVQIYNCNRGATVATYRNRQWPIPDVKVAEGTTCNSRVSHGDGPAGDYHFTVKKTDNDGVLRGDVSVRY